MKSYEELITEYTVRGAPDPADQTNEDLAVRIGKGERNLVPALWNRVLRFVILRCRAYHDAWSVMSGGSTYEIEDLIQTSFLEVEPAAVYYEGGNRQKSFLGILGEYYMRNAFRKLRGIQTSKRDALQFSVSGDAPVDSGSEDPETVFDLIRDPSAEFEDDIYRAELHDRLDAAMEEELRPEEETVLRLYYYEGKTDPEIGSLAGCTGSMIQAKRKDALRKLYLARRRQGLDGFLEDHTNYYQAAGVGVFHRTGSSAVENIVLRREDLRERYLRGEE